jgi:hypothetical protein
MKITDMVLVLKKGASKKEIQVIEKSLTSKKERDLSKYCGILKLKEDPLSIQKQIRNDWE